MKKALLVTMSAIMLAGAIPTAAFAEKKQEQEATLPSNSSPNQSSTIITPNSIPIDEGSFTLIGESTDGNKFTKGLTSIVIGGTAKIVLDGLAQRFNVKGFAVGGTTSLIGSSIAYILNNTTPTVYYKFRIGISWNSTYNYYEYITTSVRYSDENYSNIIDVDYYNTGVGVPSDVLARYGLGNY